MQEFRTNHAQERRQRIDNRRVGTPWAYWVAGLLGLLVWVLDGGAADTKAQGNASATNNLKTEAVAAAKRTDVLCPNDLINVKVFQEEDLEVKATIDRDGMITLPLLGPLKVGDLTAKEATAMIRDLYEADYLVNPQVSLVVVERAKRHYTVMGQVQKPGTYELPTVDSLNLLQAIAVAGGYTRLAAPSKVTVQRFLEGKSAVLNLNAEKMARDRKAKPLEILPDDIVTVGERVF